MGKKIDTASMAFVTTNARTVNPDLPIDLLLAKSQPDFYECESPLDSEVFNGRFYAHLCKRKDPLGIELFRDVSVCWDGVYSRDLDLLEFPGLFAVVSHKDHRVEFVLAYSVIKIFGVDCATNVRQWESGRVLTLTGVPKAYPRSVSAFIMAERLLARYPVVTSASPNATRFWWKRIGDAKELGYSIFEMDNGGRPRLLSHEELRDRGWKQPPGMEFPGKNRVAIIARPDVW